ncbi:3-deoxy-7-phosphoheptulonate synthase [Spongiactinospora gelatinilytica]|uniref:3-deoxy-7-phosphoheptulonate synthase n=1 Tax=Spongiactinospora gelatinilytica TaxID=2666298 RepID=A0A2W2ILA1_9ACTN|nr:3-deoxy-7-phosphoheptulonate synthase [Spongiactinospora gelatinilytica]PZG50784.1 3-deoxy-7-phosphoheptulonate synthase [Spongiactinospora gelatinilytica]
MPSSEMLYVFQPSAQPAELDEWLALLAARGGGPSLLRLGPTPVIAAAETAEITAPAGLPRPVATVRAGGGVRLSRREIRPEGTVVSIGPARIGDGRLAVFAGPCAVESREQMDAVVGAVAAGNGVVGLRGGAFKPRTSPYAFHGLKWSGLDLLQEAREKTGLPILTEVVDTRHVERVAEIADAFQIGARNMQNFELLREVGETGRPVVLKRGFGCTVDETLSAAEYILAAGNDQVILCERGIRTFEHATRFTLDISAVALLKQRSHLPVMVDPSHSTGRPNLVAPVSLAAVAAGADALLIDVHAQPEQALCDGAQALRPSGFHELMGRLEMLVLGLGRDVSVVMDVDVRDATVAGIA